MKFEMLKTFLDGKLSSKVFAEAIKYEVKDFRRAKSIKGGSAPIVVLGTGKLSVGRQSLQIVCDAYLDGSFDNWDLSYICDSILLLNQVTFSEDGIEDAFASLTDPEINSEINRGAVEKIKCWHCSE